MCSQAAVAAYTDRLQQAAAHRSEIMNKIDETDKARARRFIDYST